MILHSGAKKFKIGHFHGLKHSDAAKTLKYYYMDVFPRIKKRL